MTWLEAANQRRWRPDGQKEQSKTMRIVTLLALLMIAIGSTGCVYRANISQGNLIKQEDLA